MSNMREIAKHAGVSLTTVSRVFNNHPLVNEKTRKVVLEACEKLQYAIDPKLQDAILSAKSGFTKRIAIVLINIDLESNAYIKWINCAVKECNKRHYQCSIISIPGETASAYELPSTLRDERCDGMIISGGLNETVMKVLSGLDIPGIVVGNYPDSYITRNFSNVNLNFSATIENLLQKLLDRGARNIAYVEENPDNFAQQCIRDATMAHCASMHIRIKPENIFLGNGPMTGMLEILKPVFQRKELDFDGILIPDDRIAQEADKLNFMRSEMYQVPQIPIATLVHRFHSGYEHIFIFPDIEAYQNLAISSIELLLDGIFRKNKGEIWKRTSISV